VRDTVTEQTIHTCCRICVANCGISVTVDEAANTITGIEPDRDNVHTWRDFCRKGKRLVKLSPTRAGSSHRCAGKATTTTYDEAIKDIAQRLNVIIDRDGPEGSQQTPTNSFGALSMSVLGGSVASRHQENRQSRALVGSLR